MAYEPKALFLLGNTRRVLQSLPESVRGEIGYALRQVQDGLTPYDSKRLRGSSHTR